MEALNALIPHDRFEVKFISDIHYGHIGVMEPMVDTFIDETKNARVPTYVLGNGDYVENISVKDKRFKQLEHGGRLARVLGQHNYFIEKFKALAGDKPLLPWEMDTKSGEYVFPRDENGVIQVRPRGKQQLLGLGEGNHEEYTDSVGDVLRDLTCRSLGVPFLTYTSRVNLTAKDGNVLKLFMWHGAGKGLTESQAKDPEQSRANVRARLALKMSSRWNDTHVNVMGHIHRTMAWRPTAHRGARFVDGRAIPERPLPNEALDISKLQGDVAIDPHRRWYGVTGTAKGMSPLGQSDWEEKMGFSYPDPGYVKLVYNKGLVHLEEWHWTGEGFVR